MEFLDQSHGLTECFAFAPGAPETWAEVPVGQGAVVGMTDTGERAAALLFSDITFFWGMVVYMHLSADLTGDGAGDSVKLRFEAYRVPYGTPLTYAMAYGATPIAVRDMDSASFYYLSLSALDFMQDIRDDPSWAPGDGLCLVVRSADTGHVAWRTIHQSLNLGVVYPRLMWGEQHLIVADVSLPAVQSAGAGFMPVVCRLPFYPFNGVRWYGSPSGSSSWGNGFLGFVTTAGTTCMLLQGVDLPRGLQIDEAWLKLRIPNNQIPEGIKVKIHVSLEDNATVPTSYAAAASRPRGVGVAWDVPMEFIMEGGTRYLVSPDISGLVQEVLDRPGWEAGNALLVLLDDNGTPEIPYTHIPIYGDGNVAGMFVIYSPNEMTLPMPEVAADGRWGGNAADSSMPLPVATGYTGGIGRVELTLYVDVMAAARGEVELPAATATGGITVIPPIIGLTVVSLPSLSCTGATSHAAAATVSLWDTTTSPGMVISAHAASRGAITLPIPFLSATGESPTRGLGVVALPLPAAAAGSGARGALSLSLPQAAAQAAQGGRADVALPVFALSGGVGARGAITLPIPFLSATGESPTRGLGVVALPLPAAAAGSGARGALSLSLPQAAAQAAQGGRADVALPLPGISGVALRGVLGAAATALPLPLLAAAAKNEIPGAAALALPGLVGAATAKPGTVAGAALRMALACSGTAFEDVTGAAGLEVGAGLLPLPVAAARGRNGGRFAGYIIRYREDAIW